MLTFSMTMLRQCSKFSCHVAWMKMKSFGVLTEGESLRLKVHIFLHYASLNYLTLARSMEYLPITYGNPFGRLWPLQRPKFVVGKFFMILYPLGRILIKKESIWSLVFVLQEALGIFCPSNMEMPIFLKTNVDFLYDVRTTWSNQDHWYWLLERCSVQEIDTTVIVARQIWEARNKLLFERQTTDFDSIGRCIDKHLHEPINNEANVGEKRLWGPRFLPSFWTN